MPGQVKTQDKNFSIPEALGQSEAFLEFQEKISMVAPVERPVLIIGERGTGKELAASRIHFLSRRWQNSFVTLNCAALSPGLIGSELFGYEKGAFTGAGPRRAGRFELASSGTLFLDEIGNIPMEVQEKILRAVEYGRFERVGSPEPVSVDVRIVGATNADLGQMADSGVFRRDLLDRLSFEVLYVPPLRFRKGDIPVLAGHFAARMAFELGWNEIPEIAPAAMKELEAYSWPGNIRQLKNVIERAVYKSSSPRITHIDFNPFKNPFEPQPVPESEAAVMEKMPAGFPGSLPDMPFKKAVAEFECSLVSKALHECRFHQKKAAAKLGLTYDQFRGLLKKYSDRL